MVDLEVPNGMWVDVEKWGFFAIHLGYLSFLNGNLG